MKYIMVCPITLQCLYAQTIQLPVSSTSACNNPSLEISEKSRVTVDVIVRTIITRVRNRVLYKITHDCDRILPGHCTRKQSARGTLAGLFVTDSSVTPVGYSCQLDLPVSLAASSRLAWPNSLWQINRLESASGTLLECSILVECTGSHVLSYIYWG